jgi:hypothetical protein
MLSWLMMKIGFISISEAEKYDSTLVYKIDGKPYSRKIVDYFNDDGIAFRDRQGEMFTLDNINAEDVKIIKYDGQIVFSVEDAKTKMEHINKLELMVFLYADIVQNRPKINNYLFKNLVTKFKMATSYNSKRTIEDIDSVIGFMKNEIWVDLYGKSYDDF